MSGKVRILLAAYVLWFLLPAAGVLLLKPATTAKLNAAEAWPSIHELVLGDATTRRAVSDRLVNRIHLKDTAISFSSTVKWKLFGEVVTDAVVSGQDGWLFLRDDFNGGNCFEAHTLNAAADRLSLFRDIAGTVGIDFQVVMIPNKTEIYRDKFTSRIAAMAACDAQNAAAIRKVMQKSLGAAFVDPTDELKCARRTGDVFFKTDTHWNRFGAAVAADHMLDSLVRDDKAGCGDGLTIAPGEAVSEDLAGNLLRVEVNENDVLVEKDEQRKLQNAVIVHDSFIDRYEGYFKGLFPGSEFYNLNEGARSLRQADLERTAKIIFESVERFILGRGNSSLFAMNGILGSAILSKNLETAERKCRGEVIFNEINKVGSAPKRYGNAIQAKNSEVCLLINWENQESKKFNIYFSRDTEDPDEPQIWRPYSLSIHVGPDEQRTAIMLPSRLASDAIYVQIEGDEDNEAVRMRIIDPER